MSRFRIPSLSFSGAGFLGAYHAGVYSCLLKHGYLLKPLERAGEDFKPPILTGVSAGALISAAISAGVTPEDAMNFVLTIAKKTSEKGGFLDVLKPGFSLIDEVDEHFELEMQKALGGSAESPGDYDNDLLMNRIRNGKLLIGLTDRRKFGFMGKPQDLGAYVYANEFRNIKDVNAACILSSYIPLGTGPLDIELESENLAVKRAWDNVKVMENLGFLSDGISGKAVCNKHQEDYSNFEGDLDTLRYLDGGLVNMFPVVDKSTVIVSPVNGMFSKNKCIAPSFPAEILNIPNFEICDGVEIGVNTQNIVAFYQMARSSSPQVLNDKFRDGHDDATRFLDDNNLLTVFKDG